MYQEIYIDVVFAANLLMDYLLRSGGMVPAVSCGAQTMLCGGCSGRIWFLPDPLYSSENTPVLTVALHGFCAMVMLRIGLKIQKGALLLKAFLMLYPDCVLMWWIWEAVSREENTYDQSFSVMRVCGVHRQQCISFCSGLDPGGQTEYLSGDVWLSGQSAVGVTDFMTVETMLEDQ